MERDLELEEFIYLWEQNKLSYFQKKRLVWQVRYWAWKSKILSWLASL